MSANGSSNGKVAPAAFPPPVDSQKEFIKRGLDDEDELIEVGVAIVGGGTAGIGTGSLVFDPVSTYAPASSAWRCWKRAIADTEITSLPWFLKFGTARTGTGSLVFGPVSMYTDSFSTSPKAKPSLRQSSRLISGNSSSSGPGRITAPERL